MTGGGPKKANLPPLPDPTPEPAAGSVGQGAVSAGEREQRLIKKKRGRSSLILTESTLGSPSGQRASLLGDTGAL